MSDLDKKELGLTKRREDLKRKRDEETQKTIDKLLTKGPKRRRNRKGDEFVDEGISTGDTLSYISTVKDGKVTTTLNIANETVFEIGNKYCIY